MRRTLLIARQEFVKYITRRGFWISIFLFPVWLALIAVVPVLTAGGATGPSAFTVIDRASGYTAAIREAVMRANDGAPLQYVYVPPPQAIVKADHLAKVLRPYLSGSPPQFDAVVLVPEDFGQPGHATAQVFAHSLDSNAFSDRVNAALTDALRLKAVRKMAPSLANSPELKVAAAVEHRRVATNDEGNEFASYVPVALAFLLFIVSVMNSSTLLQGVIEEKSTRMIEVLLSCATPREITTGKLLGVIAVALVTVFLWGAILLAMTSLAGHGTVSLVFSALGSVAEGGNLPLMLLYFLCGLLIFGSIFLAIGSMATSLADAQSLLGPTMLILMFPNLMMAGVLRAPNGTLATVFSWIPIYTPFFMMLRLSYHPPLWQVIGTAILTVVTATVLIMWTGRVFAKHVLSTERPPTIGRLFSRILRRA